VFSVFSVFFVFFVFFVSLRLDRPVISPKWAHTVSGTSLLK